MIHVILAFLLWLVLSVNLDCCAKPLTAVRLIGAEAFCLRYVSECEGSLLPKYIVLTKAVREDLNRVNDAVNREITYVTDQNHWGVEDQWDIPTDGKGDCEDFALEKRRRLVALGYPRQALVLTYVLAKKEGHAVLTVMTDQGRFALDLIGSLQRPESTGHTFIGRESGRHPGKWLTWESREVGFEP